MKGHLIKVFFTLLVLKTSDVLLFIKIYHHYKKV